MCPPSSPGCPVAGSGLLRCCVALRRSLLCSPPRVAGHSRARLRLSPPVGASRLPALRRGRLLARRFRQRASPGAACPVAPVARPSVLPAAALRSAPLWGRRRLRGFARRSCPASLAGSLFGGSSRCAARSPPPPLCPAPSPPPAPPPARFLPRSSSRGGAVVALRRVSLARRSAALLALCAPPRGWVTVKGAYLSAGCRSRALLCGSAALDRLPPSRGRFSSGLPRSALPPPLSITQMRNKKVLTAACRLC